MQTTLLLIGDLAVLYLGLLLTLVLRYGSNFGKFTDAHLAPFSALFVLWLIVFYVSGLYDPRRLRNNIDFLKTLSLAIAVSAVISTLFFYFVPYFGITPKTNLLIFTIVFAILEATWRSSFNKLTAGFYPKTRVALIGSSRAAEEIYDFVGKNPRLGYEISIFVRENEKSSSLKRASNWEKFVRENGIDLIVIPRRFKNETDAAKIFYGLLTLGVDVTDLPTFYETIFQKVPLDEVNEEWFLDEIVEKEKFYDNLKRGIELALAIIIGIALLPIEIIAAALVKISSPGPAIYKQTRVGRNREKFTIYKFRTMKINEAHKWPEENDRRITRVGKFLRRTHIDELPQLINIIKGDVSFVGPRPDFVDFYENLEKSIPHYSIRTLVRPGVTGWAQVKYPITASLEQTRERLAYDLYYIKNRSVALDIVIIVKTIKVLFTAQGR